MEDFGKILRLKLEKRLRLNLFHANLLIRILASLNFLVNMLFQCQIRKQNWDCVMGLNHVVSSYIVRKGSFQYFLVIASFHNLRHLLVQPLKWTD